MSVKRVSLTIPIPLPNWKWALVLLYGAVILLADLSSRIEDKMARDIAVNSCVLMAFWIGCWYRGRLDRQNKSPSL